MNIYEQQAVNRRWTVAIVGVFLAFFLFLGMGFDTFVLGMKNPVNSPAASGYSGYDYGRQRSDSIPYGTFIAVIVAVVMIINAASNGPGMVLASTHARPADPSLPDDKRLLNVVEEISLASGLPRPKVYVVPDPDPNAFATGFSHENSYVAVTEGLLKTLNREELQGVVAHEISHIRNYDVRLMTMVAALGGAIVLLSDWAARTMRGSRSGERGRGGGNAILFAVWILLIILAPIIVRLMAMAVSRKREYLADASGAELTRNPLALASALEKISKAVEPTKSVNQGVAHMCIADPAGGELETKENFWADLFTTHPPADKRVLALKMMAYQKT